MARVAIVRGTNPYTTTLEALTLIKEDLISIPSSIFLKPNLLLTRKHSFAITDPAVCAAVADFFKKFFNVSEITLGEGTTSGYPPDTYRSLENNGYSIYEDRWKIADLTNDPPGSWVPLYCPGLSDNLEIGISKTVIDSPFLISIPKFKTHDVLGLTLSLKNLMGTLTAVRNCDTKQNITEGTPDVCAYMHGYGDKKPDRLTTEENIGPSKVALATNLLRLTATIQPSLAVIDGIKAMEGDGPASRGTKKSLGLIIASTDFIAADTIATHIAGFNPKDFQYIYQAGHLLSLGESDPSHIQVLGEPLDKAISPFRPHHLFHRAKFTASEIFALQRNLDYLKNLQ
ncbi:MAG: DUF362 domain-containing protein [Candidatus Helarchaeota archaeon]